MENDKIQKVIDAAKLYYQLDYSQQEIAKKLGISRPTVSRLLKQAKAEGIVQINIIDPSESGEQLANELIEAFQLKDASVAFIPKFEDMIAKKYLGEEAAIYLNRVVKDQDIIATSWGTTLYEAATIVKHKHVKDVTIVQLNGGVSHSGTKTYATEIIHLLGEAYQAHTQLLPLPAIVDHLVVKQAIEADRHVRKVLDLGKSANIALFSVGVPTADSVIVQAEYLSDEDLNIIHSQSVGEICSRFFDQNGALAHEQLNKRTIGIELNDLTQKEKAILVAGGPRKVEAIYGALQGGYANVLITDQFTAKALLERKSQA
ncbi:sugar-binding transcriptional regulator [Bacillus taeanensis]|uniref:RNA polymerase subunit sigma-70 n=1 Tax=Bacillus taeanensis TaxID=273032 RepID=A0A366XTQ5_9BACI|nr:sugar-binding transcriptional regulator [Bacillus taeanensis]RBW69287.1 RNA polymerase subunit sigma-70 [Bacillus taeanensis]